MGGPHRAGVAAGLGLALTPLAAARPAAPLASAAGPLVLARADAPGLKAARASTPAALKAFAAALRPAHLPAARGSAQASHFSRPGADLWSFAAVLKSRAAAVSQTTAFVAAARRAGLRPARARIGEQGWLVPARRGGAAAVVWRRQQAVGEILLAGRLKPPQLAHAAGQYAAVADARMARVLGQDAWERTLGRIPAGRKIPKSLALDLFALAYGPVPGTARPAGSAGPVEDGTLAAGAVLANWSALTAEQQAAAAHVLGIGIVQPKARRPARVRAPRYTDPHDSTFVEQPVMEALAGKWVAEYTKRTGIQLTLTVVVGTSETGMDYGEALPLDTNGDITNAASYCRIRIEPKGQKLPIPELRNTIAHEVFHCFQAQVMTPLGLIAACGARPWLVEGSASWAAWSISPLPWSSVKNWLPEYVSKTGLVLFARSYDAVGFFGHIEEATGDLWPRVQSMLLAPTNEGSYAAAGGNTPGFLETWGSSTFVDTKLGPNWTFTRPVAPDSGFAGTSVPLVGDDTVYAGPHAFQRYTLDVAAMQELDPNGVLLHAVRHKGYARLANIDFDLTYVTDDWFWLGPGEPKCPEGTEGEPPPATSLTTDPDLALTGGADGTIVSLHLVSLSEYCKEKQKPPKQPSGGQAGGGGGGGGGCDSCGSSNGDPHLHTFDGVFYDFQGAGEYTLVRSRSGDLEVQARSQPYPGSRDVSVNTAIAMRAGGSRVEVDRGEPLGVRVNGLGLAVAAKPTPLAGGGRIRLVSGQVEITWPDGSLVRVWSVGSWGVALLVKPAPRRRGALSGLLGNFDGNPDDDFATRAGRRLDPLAVLKSRRLLYRVLGDSWRIAQRQSLLAYARGQSTRAFTNRSFPHEVASAKALPVRARASALRFCRRLHIKNPQVFEACLLDVGLTGNGAFATTSAQLERTAGGFAKPGRAGTPKKPKQQKKHGRPATSGSTAKGATAWTRLAGAASGPISVALAGGKMVIAYRSGTGSADAVTFAASTAKDAVGAARTTLTSGWSSVGDPVLLDRPGGGLQALLTGIHGGNGDPLNGVSFAARNPDGSFGAPVPATQTTFAEFVTGSAVLAPDGAPLWASARGGTLFLWRGATASTGFDLSALTGGAVDSASVGRDRAGRYWIAWDTAFSSQQSRVGLYLLQFDPATLQPVGALQQAPASGARSYSHLALACAASCRVVYLQPHKLGGARIVSWAAGEPSPATVADFGAGHGPGEPAAAYTPSGRLWVAWWDNTGQADYGFRAVRGDGRGARGTPFALSRPAGSTNFAITVTASGENLVALTVGDGARPFVNVVAPR
jgi:von Willebrand factor type D domain